MATTTRQPARSHVVPIIPKSAEPITTCLDPVTSTQSLSSPLASVPVTTPMCQVDHSSASNNQPLVPSQSSSSTKFMSNNDAPTIPLNTTTTSVDAPAVFSYSDADLDQPSSDQHISADPTHEVTITTGTSQHVSNTHAMVTRSKAGVFKTKTSSCQQ
ncbi:hypothetical protein V6N12_062055 [Hibiscus sabdariffa]|uniref:Uncharacterized protein n=1 Tax=Hibiscus sabdariffa TaxID=183260 RepID=A0ABR2AQ55_9ROSI